MSDLGSLLTEHVAAAFPSSITKGLEYDGVDPVMVDSDIYGWALQASRGNMDAVNRERPRSTRDALVAALPSFPEEARPYYVRLAELAMAALTAAP